MVARGRASVRPVQLSGGAGKSGRHLVHAIGGARPMERLPQLYPVPSAKGRRPPLPSRRRETLRTTLWFLPAVLVAVAALALPLTYALGEAGYPGTLTLPG